MADAPLPWSLVRLTAAEAAVPAIRRTVRALYTEIYAEEPYLRTARDAQEWDENVLPRLLAAAGFRLVLAHRRPGTVPMGFALGTPLGNTTRWWSGLLEPLPEPMTRENGRQTFAVYEFAIRRPYRRLGLGRALHEALVGPWTGTRTTLTLRPSSPAAVAFWDRQGYRSVGFSRPYPTAPVYSMMLRDHDPADFADRVGTADFTTTSG
ncbi:GNAT family N-acetyltransferase [Yinghuangia soli]|uniref:GNAT family N-acetyltransferase n=1 Tax=Yinghuangia soli TaxID=2908204 RepID=A0AA41U401_9ACTN|nr:GNAT family N-acetyltransferase [Yinghuangia soli]MCF2532351.1 GNAT family N-acetyltransferase [Yinghuangia soli]